MNGSGASESNRLSQPVGLTIEERNYPCDANTPCDTMMAYKSTN